MTQELSNQPKNGLEDASEMSKKLGKPSNIMFLLWIVVLIDAILYHLFTKSSVTQIIASDIVSGISLILLGFLTISVRREGM